MEVVAGIRGCDDDLVVGLHGDEEVVFFHGEDFLVDRSYYCHSDNIVEKNRKLLAELFLFRGWFYYSLKRNSCLR